MSTTPEENPEKRKSWFKGPGCLIFLFLIILLLLSPLFWRRAVRWYYAKHIVPAASVPPGNVALVFGAAIYGDGRLSSVLRDRMDTAIDLYHNDKVSKIVVSGDNQFVNYNEPEAMRLYAIDKGVPPEDIQPDYGGRRTYDTCYRARDIFGLENAVLITQAFHLPRALFTCRQLGVGAVGVASDLRPYRGARWYEFRETAATLVALVDVIRQNPPPVLGDPIHLN